MFHKADYQPGQRVKLTKTGSSELDGLEGTLIGIAADFAEMTSYIVDMDKPLSYHPWSAIAMTEHCLLPL